MGRPLPWRACRLWVCICAAGGLSVGFPSAAGADLYLVFDRPKAHPGDHVQALYADNTGRPYPVSPIHGVRVYFVPMTHAKAARHQRPTGLPSDPLWVPLGRLDHRTRGPIRIRFVIPNVRPGTYTIGFWCRQCAPPQGATFTSAYPGTAWTNTKYSKVLRVVRPRSPTKGAVASDGGTDRLLLFGAIAAGAIVMLTLSRHRHRTGRRASFAAKRTSTTKRPSSALKEGRCPLFSSAVFDPSITRA